jgi:uracil phosphoribosyltransferase/phosphoserine phosphatase/adenylate kinase
MPEEAAETPVLGNPLLANEKKLVLVGIYGIPGSGKSALLNDLRQTLAQDRFAFYEGSEVIDQFVHDGLVDFPDFKEEEKEVIRKKAMDFIKQECTENDKVGVVVGNFMFLKKGERKGRAGHSGDDFNTLTHIIYLDTPPHIVAERRENDRETHDLRELVTHLEKWQTAEKSGLQRLCRENRVLLYCLDPFEIPVERISVLLDDLQRHDSDYNLSQAQKKLDEVLTTQDQLETVLVMDGDRTLAGTDTSSLLWKQAAQDGRNPLISLFSGPLGYSYTAFRQAVLLYEEIADDEDFDAICQDVAAEVTMHPEFASLLSLPAKHKHIGAVIVTCGVKRIWEKVLEHLGLSERVSVIGGGRISDGFVVTASVKAALVNRLQEVHRMYVWAFGESPLDIEMLCEADEAIVVSSRNNSRPQTMDAALSRAIDSGLRAHQVLLPSNAPPRLSIDVLPLVHFAQSENHGPLQTASHHEKPRPRNFSIIRSVLSRRRLRILHASRRTAASLLLTPTRDPVVSGPGLREAYRHIGWYLGTEFLGSAIGLEKLTIEHGQGHNTSGYRLLHEQQTLIVALMGGGEPMAFGINDAFPLATFLHARSPDDIEPEHLQDNEAVVLVDSLINSGKTIMEFVQAIRKMHATIRIVVAAGIVQAEFMSGGELEALGRYGNVSLIALQLSDNITSRSTPGMGNRQLHSA